MENNEKIAKLLMDTGDGKIVTTEITQDQLGELFFGEGNRKWDNIQIVLPDPVWTRFYEDGVLIYEGFAIDQKAFGPGKVFWKDGKPKAEGIFGLKGLLYGKEYYPNGMIRFEGSFKLNQAYGPNYPEYGSWFDEQGKLKYHGRFIICRSSIGYPLTSNPKGFTWNKDANPKDHVFIWEDARRYMKQAGVEEVDR